MHISHDLGCSGVHKDIQVVYKRKSEGEEIFFVNVASVFRVTGFRGGHMGDLKKVEKLVIWLGSGSSNQYFREIR